MHSRTACIAEQQGWSVLRTVARSITGEQGELDGRPSSHIIPAQRQLCRHDQAGFQLTWCTVQVGTPAAYLAGDTERCSLPSIKFKAAITKQQNVDLIAGASQHRCRSA